MLTSRLATPEAGTPKGLTNDGKRQPDDTAARPSQPVAVNRNTGQTHNACRQACRQATTPSRVTARQHTSHTTTQQQACNQTVRLAPELAEAEKRTVMAPTDPARGTGRRARNHSRVVDANKHDRAELKSSNNDHQQQGSTVSTCSRPAHSRMRQHGRQPASRAATVSRITTAT